MNKFSYTLILVLLWCAPVFGQAFSDIAKIEQLRSSSDIAKGDKIAKLILPYFILNGAIDKERINILDNDLKQFLNNYIEQKSKNLAYIKQFAESDPAAISKKEDLLNEFKTLSTAVDQLNEIIKNDTYSKILGWPNKVDQNSIPSTIDTSMITNQLNQIDSLKKLTVAYDTASLENLEKKFNITENNSTTQIREMLKKVSTHVADINKAKGIIFKIVKDNFSDKIIEFGKGNNPNVTMLTVSDNLKNYYSIMDLSPTIVPQAANLSSFTIPSQSEMIDAMVIFISKRFSQEVAISFIDVIKKRAKTMQLVSDLFPTTVKLLEEGAAYEVPKIGSAWHQAIAKDLYDLPQHIQTSEYIKSMLKNGNANNYLKVLEDVVKIAQLAREGNSLPEIVTQYKSNFFTLNDPTAVMGFELINFINQELSNDRGDTVKKTFWINWAKLNSLNDKEWQLFLQLITSKYKNTIFNQATTKLPIDRLNDPKWISFKNYLSKALMLLNQFQDRKIASLAADNNLKNIKTISFWECQQQLFNLLLTEPMVLPKGATNTLSFINNGLYLYRLQEEGNYPAMIRESIKLIGLIVPETGTRLNQLLVKDWKLNRDKFAGISKQLDDKLESVNTLYGIFIGYKSVEDTKRLIIKLDSVAKSRGINISGENLNERLKVFATQYMDTLKSVNKNAKHLLALKNSDALYKLLNNSIYSANKQFATHPDPAKKSLTVVLKTAEFFTDVMSAKDSKQLSQVIEAYALPPNSYKIKRNTRYSIDLEAHVGLYGGAEYLGRKTTDSIDAWAPVWGLSAPIGISFSWGSRKTATGNEITSFVKRSGIPKSLKGNSFTLTLSVIDIGAPLAFRLSNDAEEALPKQVTWSQIFSPGLHARWGIKNTPLNISTGLQYTPQLRQMNLEKKNQQAYRGYVGLFFDLPLFNIYKR